MKYSSRILPLVLAVAFVVCRVETTPAEDQQFELRPIPASAVHHSLQQRPHIRIKDGTSANWAGYAVATSLSAPQSGSVSGAQGSWTVPAVRESSSSYTYSSVWVGIDGYSDSTVEQIGTEQDWSPSGPQYFVWFEMYPQWGYEIVGFPISPGDRFAAEVEYMGGSTYRLSITNVTKKVAFSINQSSRLASRQSAEWIVEAPWSGSVLPLANFGTVSFSNCVATVNGHTGTISDSTWRNDPLTMVTSSGTVKASVSALSPDGKSFSSTWHHE